MASKKHLSSSMDLKMGTSSDIGGIHNRILDMVR